MTTETLHRRMLLATGLAAFCSPLVAAKTPAPTQLLTADGVTLVIRDLSPRFLDFFAAAQHAAPDERFQIWKDRYDFAATPPTPAGDLIARRLLEAAWRQYPKALPVIKAGAKGMKPDPFAVLMRVTNLLQASRPISIGLTTYIGAFETNAFTSNSGDGPVVFIPLEIDDARRALLLPHELTHAVHEVTAKLSAGYERSLGRVIFEEGLAMRAVERLHPGLSDHEYVGEKIWFDEAMAKRSSILTALRPVLDARDPDAVFKFTMGKGATGLEREAYIAGWLVVGDLLAEGATFSGLARLPEVELPQTVRRIIDGLLTKDVARYRP